MPQNIQVLLGPYRSGKSLKMLQQILTESAEQPLSEFFMVVPSHRYKKLVEMRIAKVLKNSAHKAKGLGGLRLLTFYQFCELVLARTNVFPRLIPAPLRISIVETVLKELSQVNALKSLQPVAGYAGTAQALLDLIDELERSSLSPDHVISKLQESAAQQTRYLELATVYDAYWRKLDELGYIDERRMLYLLLRHVSAGKALELPETICFDGFDRFNPLQLKAIEAVSHHVKSVIMSFDYIADGDLINTEETIPYAWKKPSFEQLLAIFGNQAQMVPSPSVNQFQPEMRTFVAADRYLEMQQIAAEIKASLVSGQTTADQVLVTARDLGKYGEAVSAAFEDAGLECFVDEPIRLLALPVVQFLLGLLEIHQLDFQRGKLVALLRSRYLNPKHFDLNDVEVTRLDRYSIEQRVIGGASQWQSAIRLKDNLLANKLAALTAGHTPTKATGTAYDFVGWAEDLIDQTLNRRFFDRLSPYEKWEVESGIAELRTKLAELIQKENLEIDLGVSSPRPFKDFLTHLRKQLEKSNFRRRPRSHNAVLACSAELAPSRMFDNVYIAGLSEGEFPKRTTRSGFVSYDEVAAWSSYGVDIHNPRFEPGYESALLHALFQLARKVVTVSTPHADMSGEESVPAFLFTELAKAKQTVESKGDFIAAQLARPVSARWAELASTWLKTRITTDHPYLVELKEQLAEPYMVLQARSAPVALNSYNGYLTDYVAAGSLDIRTPKVWSASQLNEYGKCPFRYWVSKMLNLQPFEEPAAGLTVLDLGKAYHRVLELIYNQLIEQQIGILDLDEIQTNKLVDLQLRTLFSELETDPTMRKSEFWEYEKLNIAFRVRRFMQEERGRALRSSERFIPFATERSFGMDEPRSVTALTFQLAGQQIAVRGQIDRIDQKVGLNNEPLGEMRVIDYKLGSGGISSDDQRLGANLQLPLYAMAIEQNIKPGSRVTAGNYLSVLSGQPIGSLFPRKSEDSPDDAGPLNLTRELTASFVTKIGSGRFAVKPSQTKFCRTCDHVMVCRLKEAIGEEDSDGSSD